MKIRISNKTELVNPDPVFAQILANELTLNNPKYLEAVAAGRSTWGIDEVIKNFTVDPYGNYLMPRGYFDIIIDVATQLGITVSIEDNRHYQKIDWPNHIVIPYAYQHVALSIMANYSEGLLVSPAGSGKTIMGICLMLMAKQKVLWLTHTKNLLNQTKERMYEMIPNLSVEDMGIIGSGKWGIGNKVTIGLVQTLVRNPDKVDDLMNEFGMVIADECHHVPSTTFTNVITALNPYYLYGLTATFKRRDGLEQMLFQNIGPIRHEVPREVLRQANAIMTPQVKPVMLDIPNIVGDSYSEMLDSMMNNDQRNTRIIQDVVAEARKGHVCIIITERRLHGDLLYQKLKYLWPKCSIATGNYKQREIEEAIRQLVSGESTILITTSHMLGEGFDHKPLNRLFVGLPFRSETGCEQIVGRIQRTSEGKVCAVIHDYIDTTHGLAVHQYKNSKKPCRHSVYVALGCSFID